MYCRPMAITPKKYNMASNDMLGSLGISGRWQCLGKTAIWASGTMFVSLSSVWLYHKKIHRHIAITHALHLAVYFSKINMMSCIHNIFTKYHSFLSKIRIVLQELFILFFLFFLIQRDSVFYNILELLYQLSLWLCTAQLTDHAEQWLFWENVNFQIPSISSFTTAIIRIRLNTG